MARSRIVVLAVVVAGLAGFVGFVSTPTALSDPAYQTASDSTLAALVPLPATAYAYAGNDYAAGSLPSFFSNAFNTANAGDLASALWNAGKGLIDIDPWVLVPTVLFSPVGGYIAYKAQSEFFHWITDQWGANASGDLYLAEAMPVHQGVPVCVGGGTTGYPVNFVPPADGMLLEASNGSGYCSGAEGPVSWDGSSSHVWVNGVSMGTVPYSAIAGDYPGMSLVSVGAKLQGMSSNAEVWFSAQPLGVAPSGAHIDSMGTTPINTTINCTGSGPEGWGCTGTAFNGGPGTPAEVAAALRNILSQDSVAAGLVDCMLTGTCPTTSIAPTFAMPYCYGFTVPDCEAAMDDLGFTGSLDSQDLPVDQTDYTQPAGVVITTAPAATQSVSTAATTTVAANTNPDACELDVQNPHESTGSPGQIDVKSVITCTYATTVTANLTLWKCDEPPSADLDQLNNGAWGCVETPGSAVNEPADAQPNQGAVFQVPPPGSGISITPDGKYYIAYGTCDKCEPATEFSNIVGPLS